MRIPQATGLSQLCERPVPNPISQPGSLLLFRIIGPVYRGPVYGPQLLHFTRKAVQTLLRPLWNGIWSDKFGMWRVHPHARRLLD